MLTYADKNSKDLSYSFNFELKPGRNLKCGLIFTYWHNKGSLLFKLTILYIEWIMPFQKKESSSTGYQNWRLKVFMRKKEDGRILGLKSPYHGHGWRIFLQGDWWWWHYLNLQLPLLQHMGIRVLRTFFKNNLEPLKYSIKVPWLGIYPYSTRATILFITLMIYYETTTAGLSKERSQYLKWS